MYICVCNHIPNIIPAMRILKGPQGTWIGMIVLNMSRAD